MDRKDRSKKKGKFDQMHFVPSSYLGGTRAHEVPVSKVPNREPQPQCVDVTVPGHTHMLFCQALPLFLG